MSQITICDICGEPTGLEKISLSINAVINPRDDLGTEIFREIDACRFCIQSVPDLASDHALDELKRVVSKAQPWRFDPTKA